jgi:hypothetical protein
MEDGERPEGRKEEKEGLALVEEKKLGIPCTFKNYGLAYFFKICGGGD